MKYLVQEKFSYGWDDAGWTEDDVPLRFDTVEDAVDEISDHLTTYLRAVMAGDIEGPPLRRCNFRVVPTEE